jgi:hypothetical protein
MQLTQKHSHKALEILGNHPNSAKLEQLEVITVFAWVRSKLENPESKPSTGIYVGLYKELPPPEFGEHQNVVECCEAIRRVKGMRALSEQEIQTVQGYGMLLCEMARKDSKSSNHQNKKGCFGVIVVVTLILASIGSLIYNTIVT